jgi:hypothetical protein
MAALLEPLSIKGHCLRSSSWMEVARGGAVCVYLVNHKEYPWRGAARSLCLTGLDGLAQGGGAIWCRGGIDGWPAKVNAKIHVLEMVCG